MQAKSELRTFGIGLAIFFLLVGSLLYYRGNFPNYRWFFAVSGLILLIATFRPGLLASIHRVMARFARAIGWVNTMALLSIIFYGVFTPVGLLVKLLGRDSLDRKWDRQSSSYWHKRDVVEFNKERYERQF
jgi:polyferredoxin